MTKKMNEYMENKNLLSDFFKKVVDKYKSVGSFDTDLFTCLSKAQGKTKTDYLTKKQIKSGFKSFLAKENASLKGIYGSYYKKNEKKILGAIMQTMDLNENKKINKDDFELELKDYFSFHGADLHKSMIQVEPEQRYKNLLQKIVPLRNP